MAPLRRSVIRTKSIQAPTGGLNARDALADMPESDAVILDNWFPTPSSVNLRNGYVNYATGMPGWVETVAHYSGYTTKKLFGVSGGNIYDVSASGAVGAAVVTGLTNSRWQHENFGTPGGQYLTMVNGADSLQLYDGSTWKSINAVSTPAITGVVTANLIHVNVYKNRLWFVEKNSMNIWYLPIDSIAGAAQSINLGSLFRLGGYLMAMANWTINDASGINDYAAFISSEGEVALYMGDDPSSSTGFNLVGMFRIGRPIGRRCYTKIGGDVIVMCADGAFPLSKGLLSNRSSRQDSLSDKIQNLINSDVQMYSANFGWQMMLYPIGNKLIVNVPQTENNTQYQYVMNTINKSWCRFTNWNASCWEFFNDELFFGGNTVVAQADFGNDDNGATINADGKTAFSYMGATGRIKQVKMARPVFSADTLFNPSIELNVDYGDILPQAPNNFVANNNSGWDVSPWDVTAWGGASQIIKRWQTVNGVGTAFSLRVKVALSGINVSWQANDFSYELGGVL